MGKIIGIIATLLALVVIYLIAWPIPVSPVAWVAPKSPGYTGAFEANDLLAHRPKLSLNGQRPPEDIAIGPDGWLYTGVEGGHVLRINPDTGDVREFANTGGQVLGVEFDSAGNLIAADAYKGLLSIDRAGSVTILADKAADGSPFLFTDDLDILPDGTIWFSDASTKFGPEGHSGARAASLAEIWEHDGTGRVLTYTPESGEIEVKLTGLVFSNGIAADPEGHFVLINETGSYRVLKFWLEGPKEGTSEVLLDNLPGYPDNINRDRAGGFFIGLVSPRSPEADQLAEKPFIRKVLWRIPGFADAATPEPYGFLLRIDEDGNVLETWQDPKGSYHDVTGGVRAEDGTIYVSSLEANEIAVIDPQD